MSPPVCHAFLCLTLLVASAAVAVPTIAPSRLSALAASDSSLPVAKAMAIAAAARAVAGDYAPDDTTCTGSRIYFDAIRIASRKASGGGAFVGKPLGRLVFRLAGAELLPKHSANARMLCTGERTGCAYSYSWCAFEPGPSELKEHMFVLKGKGRNAVGRSDELIADEPALRACAHELEGGGSYHGIEVRPGDAHTDTVLAVPVRGPGKGTSRLAIITGLAGAPPATRRGLLSGHAIIGVLERPVGEGGHETAAVMLEAVLGGARSPVKVSSCGEIFANGQTSAVSCMFVPPPGLLEIVRPPSL